jgi:O-antigen/teichoic acid export membrane protein
LSHIGVYGFGNALQRLGAFVLLPLYISRLTPEEYGVLTLASLLPFALPPILSLGLPQAITRYYHEWVQTGRAAGNLGAIWLVAVGSMLLVTVVLDLAGGLLLNDVITQAPYDPYLRLAVWWAFFSGLSLCPLCLLRIREQSMAFVLVSSGAFFLTTGLNMWAVLTGQGVIGVLWMQVVSNAAVGIFLTAWYLRQVSFVAQASAFRQAIRFSLPLVPSSVLEVIGQRADRIFLDRWVSLADIGLYALANQVGQAVKFFYDSVKPAWVPFYLRVCGERADSRSFLGHMVTLYVAGMCLAAVAVLCVASDLVHWMGRDGRYEGAVSLVPIMIGAFFLHGLAPIGSTAILAAEKTKWQPPIQLVHVTGVIFANMILTRQWGSVGAAWALLVSSGLFSAMYLFWGQIAYPLNVEWKRVGGVAMGSAVAAIGVLFTSHLWIKALLLGLLLAWVGTIALKRPNKQVAPVV